MSTIYIDEMGAVLHHRGEEILVDKEGQTLAKIPIAQIDRVVLAGPVQLSTQVMELFLKRNIPVSFMTIYGNYRGRLTPPTHKNVSLRLQQYRRYHDEAFRLRQGKAIIEAKIKNCHEFVQKYRRSHDEVDLTAEMEAIAAELQGVLNAPSRESLMGYEGTAARHYFRAFGKMVRREFSFEGRTKRPPKDPVNALLSLGYTLLFNEMLTALEAIGLDPYLGFLHDVDYGRASLAVDMVEEFRYLVDALALALVNRGELSAGDFQKSDDGGIFLAEKARQAFYKSYEKKVRTEVANNGQSMSYRRVFFNQAEELARVIRGEAAVYRPYLMR
jgi:CRISPR-associated protein Cas1